MKQIQTIEKGANFSAANFGKLAGIKDYVLELGPEEIGRASCRERV